MIGIGIGVIKRRKGSVTASAPVISGLSGTGTSYSLTVSLAGTLYVLVNTSSATLTPSQIKTSVTGATGGVGYATQAVTAGSNGFTVTFTATPSTTYYIHVAAESAGVLSASEAVTSYTEPAAGVSVGTPVVAKANPTTSLAVAKPADATTGDKLLLMIFSNSKAPGGTDLAGFTALSDATSVGGGNNMAVYAYWKTVGAGEQASYTITFGASAAAEIHLVTVKSASAIATGATKGNVSGFANSITPPTLPATANSVIVYGMCYDGASLTAPGTVTVMSKDETAGNYTWAAMTKEGPVSAGTTTARAHTLSANTDIASVTVELKA